MGGGREHITAPALPPMTHVVIARIPLALLARPENLALPPMTLVVIARMGASPSTADSGVVGVPSRTRTADSYC